MEAIRTPFGLPGLCKRQGGFACWPLVAPIKTHLTLELANHIFQDARVEPAERVGGVAVGPPD